MTTKEELKKEIDKLSFEDVDNVFRYIRFVLLNKSNSFYEEKIFLKKILERDGWKCRRCGVQISPNDSLIATSLNGDPGRNIDNFVTICINCAKKK